MCVFVGSHTRVCGCVRVEQAMPDSEEASELVGEFFKVCMCHIDTHTRVCGTPRVAVGMRAV
jgi:hypothetical protein